MHLRHIISIGLLFLFLLGSSGSWAVDCPQNSYILTTQAEVDAFPQNCDSVYRSIYIESSNDITNVDSLSGLTSVDEFLIIARNTALTNIDGLSNLTSVGNNLYIAENTSLTDLDGLVSLTSVSGDLDIADNESLGNLDGLSSLGSVGRDLYLLRNIALSNCKALAPVLGWPSGPPDDSVGGSINVRNNATGCDSTEAILASVSGPVNLSGNIETVVVGQGAKIEPVCAMALASGEFMFSCDPIGEFSLENLPREADGSVVRQIYADGFFPSVTTLTESGVGTVRLDRAFNCPSYNLPSNPDVIPASAGNMHSIAGRVLLQATDTPICALVLANGAYKFSCDDGGTYSLEFPLDVNGQYKLQVYADGFAPAVQTFNEFDDPLNVRMARSSECESAPASQN
jgi:hypothetical protein